MAKAKAKRDKNGRFLKGASGNPGGNRALPAELRLRLVDMVPKAVARLEELVESKDEKVAARAVELLFQRVYGRPQAIPLEAPAPDSDKERLAELERQATALALGGDSRMLALMLRALDPQKYGMAEGESGDFDEEPAAVNFVGPGQARVENKWVPERAEDGSDDEA